MSLYTSIWPEEVLNHQRLSTTCTSDQKSNNETSTIHRVTDPHHSQGLDNVVEYEKGAKNIENYGSRDLTNIHHAVPIVKFVSELEDGLRTYVQKKTNT